MDEKRARRRLSGKGNLPLKNWLWFFSGICHYVHTRSNGGKQWRFPKRGYLHPVSPGMVERKGGHMGPIYKRGYGEAPRFQCIHLQLKARIWGILESLIRASLVWRRASTRFIDLSRARWLVKMVVHFFSTFFLVLVQVRSLRLVERAQCEATEKKVLRSSILWRVIEDLINQINHHVKPSSSHKLVIENGMYNCNFLVVLFRSAGALEWSLNLFDSS